MKKSIILPIALLFVSIGLRAATIQTNISEWAFTSLLDSANENTIGWFFSSSSLPGVNLRGTAFTAVTPGSTGTSGILSWNSAEGYGNNSFSWVGAPDKTERDATSHGGIWSGIDQTISLDIALNSGTDYIIELVSMQPSGGGTRTMDITVDGSLLIDNWAVSESPIFNTLLRFSGTSDGNIDIDFAAGNYGDSSPAFTIITVTPIPEPVSASLMAVVVATGIFIRRRLA